MSTPNTNARYASASRVDDGFFTGDATAVVVPGPSAELLTAGETSGALRVRIALRFRDITNPATSNPSAVRCGRDGGQFLGNMDVSFLSFFFHQHDLHWEARRRCGNGREEE